MLLFRRLVGWQSVLQGLAVDLQCEGGPPPATSEAPGTPAVLCVCDTPGSGNAFTCTDEATGVCAEEGVWQTF